MELKACCSTLVSASATIWEVVATDVHVVAADVKLPNRAMEFVRGRGSWDAHEAFRNMANGLLFKSVVFTWLFKRKAEVPRTFDRSAEFTRAFAETRLEGVRAQTTAYSHIAHFARTLYFGTWLGAVHGSPPGAIEQVTDGSSNASDTEDDSGSNPDDNEVADTLAHQHGFRTPSPDSRRSRAKRYRDDPDGHGDTHDGGHRVAPSTPPLDTDERRALGIARRQQEVAMTEPTQRLLETGSDDLVR